MPRIRSFPKLRAALITIAAAAIAGWAVGAPRMGPGKAAFAAHAEVAAALREPSLRLIGQDQYLNTIAHIFGPDVATQIRFAPVNRVDGLLGVGASSAVLTGGGLDPIEAASRAVAAAVVEPKRRPFLIPCKPADTGRADPACARAFFAGIGPMLYRRPLSDRELDKIVEIAGRDVGRSGDFYDGLAYALSGMLVSPHFLFIREVSEPDPTMPGRWRLDGYSKASRLSFLLWDAAPDAELLAAAGRGELHDPARLRAQVDRMIASPLYRDGVRAFFSDFLVLEAFDTLAKDPTIYPAMTLKAIAEAREQILRTVVDHLVDRDLDYRDLFTTRRTFLTSDLAVLYRLPVHLGSQGWVPYRFSEGDPRAGLLTQIGFLAQYAHPGRSSATRRGRAIREVLLCQKVPNPPPNVDFSNFLDPKSGLTTARERLRAHSENPVCAGCHRLTDPIGLGLERFDGAGQFRLADHGAEIDPSGEFDGDAFANAAQLGQSLRDNPALKSCIVNRLYAYAVGRAVEPEDEAVTAGYEAALDKAGYRFDAMLRLMIMDPRFFTVRQPDVITASVGQPIFKGGPHAD